MKNNIYLILILIYFCSLSFSAKAQKDKPVRVEIETKSYSDAFNILPTGKKGVMLFYESNVKKKGERLWYFSKFNTNFKEIWTKKYLLDKELALLDYKYNNGKLYVLFTSHTVNHASILIIDLDKDELTNIAVELADNSEITFLEIIDDNAYLIGKISSKKSRACMAVLSLGIVKTFYKPFFLKTDLNSRKTEVFYPEFSSDANVVFANINKETETLNLIIRNKQKRDYKIFINDYTKAGILKNSTEIAKGDGRNLNYMRVIQINKSEKIFLGIYNNSSNKKDDTYNEGVFFCRIKEGKQEFIKYHPFIKFKNFYGMISPNMQKMYKRRQRNGKQVSIGYQLLFHDEVFRLDDEYIIVAEACYPEYRTEWMYNRYGRPYPVEVFKGYRYTHAIVASFDKEGSLLWDNTMSIMDVLTMDLKTRVRVMRDGKSLVMVYSEAGEIHFKVIQGSEVLEKKESMEIATTYKGDRVKTNYRSDMELWYDKYFITWGFQKIKKTGDKKREVFYFNKVAFQ